MSKATQRSRVRHRLNIVLGEPLKTKKNSRIPQCPHALRQQMHAVAVYALDNKPAVIRGTTPRFRRIPNCAIAQIARDQLSCSSPALTSCMSSWSGCFLIRELANRQRTMRHRTCRRTQSPSHAGPGECPCLAEHYNSVLSGDVSLHMTLGGKQSAK